MGLLQLKMSLTSVTVAAFLSQVLSWSNSVQSRIRCRSASVGTSSRAARTARNGVPLGNEQSVAVVLLSEGAVPGHAGGCRHELLQELAGRL